MNENWKPIGDSWLTEKEDKPIWEVLEESQKLIMNQSIKPFYAWQYRANDLMVRIHKLNAKLQKIKDREKTTKYPKKLRRAYRSVKRKLTPLLHKALTGCF